MQIQDSSYLGEFRELFRVQSIDNDLKEMKGINVTKELDLPVKVFSANGTTSGNIYVATSTGLMWIHSVTLYMAKNSTCDISTGAINLNSTIDGATKVLAYLPCVTLQNSTDVVTITFPKPVKIDKNANILISGTFTAGTCSRGASVTAWQVK